MKKAKIKGKLEDHVPSINNKCPTCNALPDESCAEGPDHAPRLVGLHPSRTVAGNRLKNLNEKMSTAVFGKKR